jgi:uncharacterized membrane protein
MHEHQFLQKVAKKYHNLLSNTISGFSPSIVLLYSLNDITSSQQINFCIFNSKRNYKSINACEVIRSTTFFLHQLYTSKLIYTPKFGIKTPNISIFFTRCNLSTQGIEMKMSNSLKTPQVCKIANS